LSRSLLLKVLHISLHLLPQTSFVYIIIKQKILDYARNVFTLSVDKSCQLVIQSFEFHLPIDPAAGTAVPAIVSLLPVSDAAVAGNAAASIPCCVHCACAGAADTAETSATIVVPRAAILLASVTNRDLWQGPKQEVCESRTSGFCAQPQKFETITVTIGQPRPQGLLAFQYGGGSGEDPGT